MTIGKGESRSGVKMRIKSPFHVFRPRAGSKAASIPISSMLLSVGFGSGFVLGSAFLSYANSKLSCVCAFWSMPLPRSLVRSVLWLTKKDKQQVMQESYCKPLFTARRSELLLPIKPLTILSRNCNNGCWQFIDCCNMRLRSTSTPTYQSMRQMGAI